MGGGTVEINIAEYLIEKAEKCLEDKETLYGKELMEALEQKILLENVDIRWMDHIDAMDQLRNGINLRAYAQQDPVLAFRQESYDMFEEMTNNIHDGTVTMLLTAVIRTEKDVQREQQMQIVSTNGAGDGSEKQRPVKKGNKVGRNDPCPCGSGKKYKKCCGRDE